MVTFAILQNTYGTLLFVSSSLMCGISFRFLSRVNIFDGIEVCFSRRTSLAGVFGDRGFVFSNIKHDSLK